MAHCFSFFHCQALRVFTGRHVSGRKEKVQSRFLIHWAAVCFLVLWFNTDYILNCGWGLFSNVYDLLFCYFLLLHLCFLFTPVAVRGYLDYWGRRDHFLPCLVNSFLSCNLIFLNVLVTSSLSSGLYLSHICSAGLVLMKFWNTAFCCICKIDLSGGNNFCLHPFILRP